MRYSPIIFLVLLVVSCNQQAPIQPIVPPQGSLGGVVITFSGISNALNASAQALRSQLQSKSLSSADGIGYTPLSQNAFTANGFRYLSATFRVTPTLSVTNLSYVARVNTAGGNATLFDTAVLNLKKFDGSSFTPSEAQTLARAVKPVQDLRRSGSGFLVNNDSADLQVWSESSASSLYGSTSKSFSSKPNNSSEALVCSASLCVRPISAANRIATSNAQTRAKVARCAKEKKLTRVSQITCTPESL